MQTKVLKLKQVGLWNLFSGFSLNGHCGQLCKLVMSHGAKTACFQNRMLV